jgi:hypothetical protein
MTVVSNASTRQQRIMIGRSWFQHQTTQFDPFTVIEARRPNGGCWPKPEVSLWSAQRQ